MQIREQGRQVQLIRSPYDSTKKRCVQKVVHTFKRQYDYSSDDINKYLSAEQVLDLSDDEKKTLSDWLRVKSDKQSADERSYAIMVAAERLDKLSDAISSDGVSAANAARIWAGLERLQKALKKAGHPRSATKPAKSPKPPEVSANQAALSL